MQVFIIVCLITSISLQSTEQRPEDVVNSYFAAMKAGDWAKCAQMVHPKSLGKSRDRANSLARALFDEYGGNLHTFFGVRTKEEYERLSDVKVLEHLLPRIYLLFSYDEILKATSFKIIGIAKERDDLVHILYRVDITMLDSEGKPLKVARIERKNEFIGVTLDIKLPEPTEERADVISVKKDDASWKILLHDEHFEPIKHIEKEIAEFNENMRKFSEALGKQQKSQRTKRKPALPRR